MKVVLLTKGQVALVDDSDYEAVSRFNWHAIRGTSGVWYARRNISKSDGTRTTQKLHQFLMPGVPMVDHEDGDGLNNRRYNLRSCTPSQNQCNCRKRVGSSKYRGVSWNRRQQKWISYIDFEGKRQHLGLFSSEEDAARAYNTAAKNLHKNFARCDLVA